MKIRMELLTDTIMGNGMSVPGAEDISVLHDREGFPYFKGTTLKGIFREELERYKEWTKGDFDVDELLGKSGDDDAKGKLIFGDLHLSSGVRNAVLNEIGAERPMDILDTMTNIRTFTRINDNGIADEGSLRIARCVNKGLVFYGDIWCDETQRGLITEILGLIKWIGTMRNRGFGKIVISERMN